MPEYGRRQVVRAVAPLPEDDATYAALYLSVGMDKVMVHDVTFRELLRDLHARFPHTRLEAAYLGDLRILIVADANGLVDTEERPGAETRLYHEVLNSRTFGVPARRPKQALSPDSARMCLREVATNPAFADEELIRELLRFEPEPSERVSHFGALYWALASAATPQCQAAFEAAASSADVERMKAAFRAARSWPGLSTTLAAQALLRLEPQDPRAMVVIDECSLDTLRELETHTDRAVVAALSAIERRREAERARLASAAAPPPRPPAITPSWEGAPAPAPPLPPHKLSKEETEALRKLIPKRIAPAVAESYLAYFASQSRSKKAHGELLTALVVGLAEVDAPAVDEALRTMLERGPIGAKRSVARQVHKRAFVRAALPELLEKLAKSSDPEDAELLEVFKEELYAEARRSPRPAWLLGASPELLRAFGLGPP